jgi:hypothetical protein
MATIFGQQGGTHKSLGKLIWDGRNIWEGGGKTPCGAHQSPPHENHRSFFCFVPSGELDERKLNCFTFLYGCASTQIHFTAVQKIWFFLQTHKKALKNRKSQQWTGCHHQINKKCFFQWIYFFEQ